MEEKVVDDHIGSSSMKIIENSPLKQILHAIESLSKRVDEMEKAMWMAKKSLDKLTAPQCKTDETHEKFDNTDLYEMKNKPCDDVTKKNSSPLQVKSENCVFTDLSDKNKDVEILHNLPSSFYKGMQTCLDGEEKSKPKSRFGIHRNSKTNKTVQELPSTFLRQKDKLARFNNPPSIQNMAFARLAKMPKIEHKGQLSSKMAETRVRKGSLTFTIDKERLTTAAKQKKMAFKNTSIPKNLNCSFKPPQDMRLSEDLVNMAMYIFAADNDIAEDLVHIHDTTATREDLFCLVPGKQVSELVIKLMALKITSNISMTKLKNVWSLPPSFADDVTLHMEDHDLLEKYAHYMPLTRDLQF
ncbi:hypothetical protein HN873_061153, partial [Arachis hypogaea]